MKQYPHDPAARRTSFARRGWLLLGSITMASIHAQLPDLKIGVDSILLTWEPAAEECVIVCAESPDGPWTPVPVPIREVDGQCQAVVKCTDQQNYFRLAKGTCFVYDFDDGDLDGWTVSLLDAVYEGDFAVEASCGHLRIYGPRTEEGDPRVLVHREDLVVGDVALSIDVLGWHDEPLENAAFSLLARIGLGNSWPDVDALATQYGSGAASWSEYPNQSAIHLGNTSNPSWIVGEVQPFPKLEPGKDYRLVFTAVGRELSVQLHDLGSGVLLQEYRHSDNLLPPGYVGFAVSDTGSYTDFLLDNFVVASISPE